MFAYIFYNIMIWKRITFKNVWLWFRNNFYSMWLSAKIIYWLGRPLYKKSHVFYCFRVIGFSTATKDIVQQWIQEWHIIKQQKDQLWRFKFKQYTSTSFKISFKRMIWIWMLTFHTFCTNVNDEPQIRVYY